MILEEPFGNDDKQFIVRSSREAHALQLRLSKYRQSRCGGQDLFRPGFLRDLFSYSHSSGDTRLFVAVYDLEITFLFMEIDISSVASVHNLKFAPGRPYSDIEPLLDVATFAGKMEILESLTAFTLRCRAFWDKFMGVLFLVCEEEKYDKFSSNMSRKRYFANRAEGWPNPPSHILKFLKDPNFRGLDPNPRFPRIIEQVVEDLDSVRTAEAHGTGTLRKSTLSLTPEIGYGLVSLVAHYNIALGATRALRRTLEDLSCS